MKPGSVGSVEDIEHTESCFWSLVLTQSSKETKYKCLKWPISSTRGQLMMLEEITVSVVFPAYEIS